MATEESMMEYFDEVLKGGSKELVVDDDLQEMTRTAVWTVSSYKPPGNDVTRLHDNNMETFWQSDGVLPHLINIQFQRKVKLKMVAVYADVELDESYTPSQISIRVGDGFHPLEEVTVVRLVKPTGWVYISLSGDDPRETFVDTFMLQIAFLCNNLDGKNTHLRQVKVYGPRLNPVPLQPFHFTSKEFITYSTIR
ncbi:anaphase-promoting complex subunit 10-like [Impatiens glandulifera]|uniref:anaphase-promoting complex subunit 10-like n=1 Tax=Impatiens glandulifera TaxID=253017 RepID=UPI001FB14337|nr:anaphase-promoting complex subunit 10-like [Impatiens glandulifera]